MLCSDAVSFKRDTTLLIKRVSSSMLNSHRCNVYITIRSGMLISINKRDSDVGVSLHGTLYKL